MEREEEMEKQQKYFPTASPGKKAGLMKADFPMLLNLSFLF